MGFLSGLGKVLGVAGAGLGGLFTGGSTWAAIPSILAAGGTALGAGAQSSAKNRGETIAALMDQDKLRLAAAGDQRASESDILKKLAQTSYLKNGGYHAPTEGYAASLPHFGFGPQPASPEQMAAAGTLQGQLMQRLNHPFQLQDTSKYTKPGLGERLMGLGGGIASFLGGALKPKTNPAIGDTSPQGPANPYDYDTHYSMWDN